MQNTIYLWFLYLFLLLSPFGLDANMDSKIIKTSALANAEVAKAYRHFPKANPLDRFRILKQSSPTLGNRPNTEGSSDSENSVKKTRSKRFWRIFGAIVGGLALIYWLQGTIWLAIATLAIILYATNRKKIGGWERNRYARMQSQTTDNKWLDKDSTGNPIYTLSHSANKWTRRAINRFATGVILGGIGLVLLLLGIVAEASAFTTGLLILGVVAAGAGYISVIISFFDACKAVANKEPKQSLAWLVITLSLLIISPILGVLGG